MSAADGHPLPWSASRRLDGDWMMGLAGEEGAVVVWDIDDADGGHVATIVEPVRHAEPADRPLPDRSITRGRRLPVPAHHWCIDDSDQNNLDFIGCRCTTRADHWADQMDRPDLVEKPPPAPTVIGAPVVLDLANTEHERREHQRTHPSAQMSLNHPGVMVNIPGMTTVVYGGRDPDRPGFDDTGTRIGGARVLPYGQSRLQLAIARAMLVDALAVIDERVEEMASANPKVAPEAVVLAADRIRAELERSHREPLPEPSDLRIVLRDVADRTPDRTPAGEAP